MHPGGHKALGEDRFFDPQHHVVAGATFVIAQIVVQADVADPTGFQQGNGLVWPTDTRPPGGGGAFVVQIDLDGRGGHAARVFSASNKAGKPAAAVLGHCRFM